MSAQHIPLPGELEKFKSHSILLNNVLWRMQEWLGDVSPEQTEIYSDSKEVIDRFFNALPLRGAS